jgi:hypothetical protein
MQGSATDRTSTDFAIIHPLDPEDAAITAAMRTMVSSTKGVPAGIEARGQFDALIEERWMPSVCFSLSSGSVAASANTRSEPQRCEDCAWQTLRSCRPLFRGWGPTHRHT